MSTVPRPDPGPGSGQVGSGSNSIQRTWMWAESHAIGPFESRVFYPSGAKQAENESLRRKNKS